MSSGFSGRSSGTHFLSACYLLNNGQGYLSIGFIVRASSACWEILLHYHRLSFYLPLATPNTHIQSFKEGQMSPHQHLHPWQPNLIAICSVIWFATDIEENEMAKTVLHHVLNPFIANLVGTYAFGLLYRFWVILGWAIDWYIWGFMGQGYCYLCIIIYSFTEV